jgi:hypothetical protein
MRNRKPKRDRETFRQDREWHVPLNYNEYGQLISPPSRILTDESLQQPLPPKRIKGTRIQTHGR